MYRESKEMTIFLITGGIGSGKSEVCRYLMSRGIPVYDSDSRTKELYDSVPCLPERIDAALGGGFILGDGLLDKKALAAAVFKDADKLHALESIVHPEVLKNFIAWKDSLDTHIAAMESAIASGIGIFEGVFDFTILVDAPLEMRIRRACKRDLSSREAITDRIARQNFDPSLADAVIVNDASLAVLHSRTDEALEKCLYLQNIKKKLPNRNEN